MVLDWEGVFSGWRVGGRIPESMKTGSSRILYFFLGGIGWLSIVIWILFGGGVGEWWVLRLVEEDLVRDVEV